MPSRKPAERPNPIKAMSLKDFRKMKGVTLKAARKQILAMSGYKLSVKDVVAIEEGREDSILKIAAYVEALGGRLELRTTIPVSFSSRKDG